MNSILLALPEPKGKELLVLREKCLGHIERLAQQLLEIGVCHVNHPQEETGDDESR
ncbi:MAG TPA: hypothetical protein VJ600_09880 [Holophagaceae bacterium]|nr:hypothetical protein [Holophagaceae bacterium]